MNVRFENGTEFAPKFVPHTASFTPTFGTVFKTGGGGGIPYEGPTEVTPTQEEQTLYTNGYLLLDNIKVNPIPSCYGLVTWNGAFITIT